MHFLPDVYVPCDQCHGKRYNKETLDIRFKGRNISEVLEMSVEEAVEFFQHIPKIRRRLSTLNDVGLGYIRLGQPATTLSGGEAQRVKLATELSKVATGRTLYILDEPTTGLHFADVERLLDVLHRLVDAGNSVVVIEHNLDVIKTADRIIDMGPEGGEEGGEGIAAGTPEEVAGTPGSHTGAFLSELVTAAAPTARRGAASATAAAGGARSGCRRRLDAREDNRTERHARSGRHPRRHRARRLAARRPAGSPTAAGPPAHPLGRMDRCGDRLRRAHAGRAARSGPVPPQLLRRQRPYVRVRSRVDRLPRLVAVGGPARDGLARALRVALGALRRRAAVAAHHARVAWADGRAGRGLDRVGDGPAGAGAGAAELTGGRRLGDVRSALVRDARPAGGRAARRAGARGGGGVPSGRGRRGSRRARHARRRVGRDDRGGRRDTGRGGACVRRAARRAPRLRRRPRALRPARQLDARPRARAGARAAVPPERRLRRGRAPGGRRAVRGRLPRPLRGRPLRRPAAAPARPFRGRRAARRPVARPARPAVVAARDRDADAQQPRRVLSAPRGHRRGDPRGRAARRAAGRGAARGVAARGPARDAGAAQLRPRARPEPPRFEPAR